MKKTIRCLIAVALVMAFIGSHAQTVYQVTADSKFRTGAGTKFKSIGLIKIGEKVNILDQKNAKWTRVEYNGKKGYISSKNLTPFIEATPIQQETVQNYSDSTKSKPPSNSLYIILIVIVFLILILTKRKRGKQDKTTSNNIQKPLKESEVINLSGTMEEKIVVHYEPSNASKDINVADHFSSLKPQISVSKESSVLDNEIKDNGNIDFANQNITPNIAEKLILKSEESKNSNLPKLSVQEFRETMSSLIHQFPDSSFKETLIKFNRVNLGYIDLAKARFELLELQNKTTIEKFSAYIATNGEIIWTDQYSEGDQLLLIGKPLTRNDYYNNIITAVKNNMNDLTDSELKPMNVIGESIETGLPLINPQHNILEVKQPIPDPSIVDVTKSSFNLKIQPTESSISTQAVPIWRHQDVYSASEINYATEEQKKFYLLFKYRFLKGEYIDLQGNTNYSFVLLFDLIDDYANHRNLLLVERQIEEVGNYYPKTKYYGTSSLVKKLEQLGDRNALEQIKSRQNNSAVYPVYNYNPNYSFEADYWGLGTKHKAKYKLTDDEVDILNKIWNPSNNFFSIEFCGNEVLKLFVLLIRSLKAQMLKEQTSFEKEILYVVDIVLRKHFRYKLNSYNYNSGSDSVKTEIYSNLFKRCENAVREKYNHKRKLNTDTYITTPEAKTELETRIINKAEGLLLQLARQIAEPDEATEVELNTQNTGRWKQKFDALTGLYASKPKEFMENVLELAAVNRKNPAIENIFFDASKFIAKTDKEGALVMYVHYLYHDLKSANFDNKKFTKTIQKNLFTNNEHLHNFEKLVSELINDKNLQKALDAVPGIYAKKRKKIQLDTESIKEVQAQHSGTVELLNEYLQDEYEDASNIIKTEETGQEEIKMEIVSKDTSQHTSAYLAGISFTDVQAELLEMFSKNNFSIQQTEVEIFAKSKSVFKNQLVERINEICFDQLDDVLIEEEDESYIMNQNYYKNLLAV